MAVATIDPSIKVLKSFVYRGVTRTVSNRYFFDNLAPADSTKWTTLSDAIVTAEKAIYPTMTGFAITGTLGYNAGSDVPVFTKSYSTAATGAFGGTRCPGDCAALVRYSTAQRSTKNHPIYLFNYYHNVEMQTGGATGDVLNPNQRTAIQTYASSWVTGFSDGAVTHHRCGPQGHVATGSLVDANIRHRDFPAA